MLRHTQLDKIRSEVIRDKVEVIVIENMVRDMRLRWFSYAKRSECKCPHEAMSND